MAENKTKAGDADVGAFLDRVTDAKRRSDGRELCAMMERLSGEKPVLWGPSIVGFGNYHYKYDSGREGDAARIGFSPRARELVLYVLDGFPRQAELLARLGKHRTGKCCLYIKSLDDVDRGVLEELIEASVADMDRRYPRA